MACDWPAFIINKILFLVYQIAYLLSLKVAFYQSDFYLVFYFWLHPKFSKQFHNQSIESSATLSMFPQIFFPVNFDFKSATSKYNI